MAIPLLFSSNVLNVTRGDSCVVEGNEVHNNINSFLISRFSLGQYKTFTGVNGSDNNMNRNNEKTQNTQTLVQMYQIEPWRFNIRDIIMEEKLETEATCGNANATQHDVTLKRRTNI